MIRIAICDDDIKELNLVTQMIEEYKKECTEEVLCSKFSNPSDLLDALRKENFGIVFLDILMPNVNGIETGREIRTFDHNVKIVYLTISPEYALESYSVNAFHYILKPIEKKQLFFLLNEIIYMCQDQDESGFAVRVKGNITSISFYQLEGVEAVGKKVLLYLNDGSSMEVLGPLSKYETLLSKRKEFIRTHRAFIVNMDKVKKIENRVIFTKANHRISISKTMNNSFKTLYMDYLFGKRVNV